MNTQRRRRRGIVMMVALLTLVFIFMLVGAAMTLMPTQLKSSQHSAESQQALRAASSGIDFAQAKVQKDPSWRGDDLSTAAVNMANLQVVEDNGNVIGVMTNGDGSRSAFRFKFNHQNGSNSPVEPGGELANPAANHEIRNQLICINNSESSVLTPIYDFPANGQLPNTATSSRNLGQFCVLLQVEGLAGPGLNTATTDNLETLLAGASGRSIYRQRVQCVLSLSFAARTDSAVYAAGSFTAAAVPPSGTGVVNVTADTGASAARLRSLNDVIINQGAYQTSTSGQVVVDEAPAGQFTHPNDGGLTTVTATHQRKAVQNDHWLKLNWNQVSHATSSDTQLKAGTYVWRPGGMGPELYYYPQNYTGTVPAPSGSPISQADMVFSGSNIELAPNRLSTIIKGRVFVEPVAGGTVKDFAVLVDPALTAAGQRPMLEFQAPSGQDALLTTTGNLTVKGPVEGYGGLTCEQEVLVEGASILEADPNSAVAIYAKGDVKIDAIPAPVAAALDAHPVTGMGMGMGMGMGAMGNSGMGATAMGVASELPFGEAASDVAFTGLVYTLKNFDVNVPNGNFYVRGILTAYGGDPQLNEAPGDGPGGNINIGAHNVEFIYDPSYLGLLRNQGDAMLLDRVSWNTL